MSNLGQKLANTIDIMKASNIHDINEQAAANLSQIKKERSVNVNWLHELKIQIFDIINDDRVPVVPIDQPDFAKWLESAMINKAANQDVFDTFVKDLKSEGLRFEIISNELLENQSNELEVTVMPIRDGHRSVHS